MDEQQIRARLRNFSPPFIRRPVGKFCGWFRSHLLYPFLGIIFDVTGGRFRAEGCTFIIPKNITSPALRASFLLRSYEKDERKLIQKYIQPEDSVLELGACLGIVSCITNKLLNNPTHHVVIEANPDCIPAIYHNRDHNHALFLVEHCAVSSQAEVVFFINPAYITGSGIRNHSEISIRVPGRSLDELAARHGVFSVLIMDIEGSELEILESSSAMLPDFRLIIIELHESIIGVAGTNRCRTILKQSGFKIAEQSYITEVWLKTDVSHGQSV